MECFNSLLLKLKEVHEREMEGWQMKIQELSNKKGCDSKRMEELFSKNQQMKEQQRLLTENIKTLENRLRAGLCDRCTVTQEVAKRRQQEFEASQMQSLQHISLLASEMNNLKKENKRLRDEIRSLRAALDRGHSDSSIDVKPTSSPDPSPPSGSVSLISMATSRSISQPAGGEVSVKTETEHRTEETEVRAWRGNNRSFESYKPLTSPTWKTENQSRAAERRSQSVEGLEQRPPLHPLTVPLKTSPSSSSSTSSSPSLGSDVTPSRYNVHPSIPCRPQPIRGSPVSIPWTLSDSSDWVSGPVPTLVTPPPIKPPPPRFPNLVLSSHGRRPAMIGQVWSKQSPLKPPKEPTVLFRLRGLPDNQMKTTEKKETLPPQAKGGPADGPREGWEGPLDLSERGKVRNNAGSREYLDLRSDKVKISPDQKNDPSETSSAAPPSSSSSPTKQDNDPSTIHTEVSEQREELNGQTEQKKVPVLTLSLRPVVVLENLNSALHKQEASSHSKSSSAETGSSSDGQEEEASSSGPESNCQRKRKRKSGGTESDRDSDTDDVRPERKIQITVRTEEKTVS